MVLQSMVPAAVSYPTPPLPSPPASILSHLRGACRSHFLKQTLQPHQGFEIYMHGHTCLVCRSREKSCSSFEKKKKSKHSHNLMPSNTRKHHHLPLPRIDPSKIIFEFFFFFWFHLNCMFYFSQPQP